MMLGGVNEQLFPDGRSDQRKRATLLIFKYAPRASVFPELSELSTRRIPVHRRLPRKRDRLFSGATREVMYRGVLYTEKYK